METKIDIKEFKELYKKINHFIDQNKNIGIIEQFLDGEQFGIVNVDLCNHISKSIENMVENNPRLLATILFGIGLTFVNILKLVGTSGEEDETSKEIIKNFKIISSIFKRTLEISEHNSLSIGNGYMKISEESCYL